MTDTVPAYPPTVKTLKIADLALREGQSYFPKPDQVIQIWDQLHSRWRTVEYIHYSYDARSGDRNYIVQHASGGLGIPKFDQRYAERFPLRVIDDPDYEYLTIRDLTPYPVEYLRPDYHLQYWSVIRQAWVQVISIAFLGAIQMEFRAIVTPDEIDKGTITTHRQFESQMLFRKVRIHVTE